MKSIFEEMGGTHPKMEAWIGPLIGPAPAIEEK